MTSVCASLSTPLSSPREDLVFCAAFALAWEKLQARFGPIRMEPQPALADALNAATLGAEVVDPAWSLSGAGFGGEGIVEALRAELFSKFPDAKPEYLPEEVPADALLAYGYLSKILKFETRFAVREGTFKSSRVRAFGLDNRAFGPDPARRAQVVVHDWAAPQDFVIEFVADDPDSRVLVAQMAPAETLAATVASALGRLDRLGGGERQLAPDEALSIPRLKLDVAEIFGDLIGRPLLGEALRGKRFGEAKQRVQFHLNEGGAGATSEAVIGSYGAPPPRSFNVTAPFLVLLQRRGASAPYLAAWVESTAWMEVLGPVPPPPVTPPGWGAGWGGTPPGYGMPPGYGTPPG
ncbi:hypothetical protein [Sorangium sp. So ce1182]|uniref:hypothetical protein n=1 Tax=Sorangium sp. So ce1182 TaxID=3133334 RepID=UPI003F60DD47